MQIGVRRLTDGLMRGLVFGMKPADLAKIGRTQRSMAAAGVIVDDDPVLTQKALCDRIGDVSTPILLVRAGAWFCGRHKIPDLSSSATGRPVIGLGAIRNATGAARFEHPAARRWTRLLARSGGDFDRLSPFSRGLPEIASIYLEGEAARELARRTAGNVDWPRSLQRLARDRRFRAVHLGELDVHDDSALRVLQLVTTIQVGGAERVTLDLATELTALGCRVCVAVLGEPTRAAFPEPPNFADLSHVANDPAARANAIASLCREFAADVVHAHLIRATEARAIKALGLPLVMTIHNMRGSWPAGLASADGSLADLLLACSQAVESDLREHGIAVPVRTVWNGIDPTPFANLGDLQATASAWRESLGWDARDFVIAAIANPRPQKRLERLPEIVHELQKLLGAEPTVRLLIAGARSEGRWEAEESTRRLEQAIDQWKVRDQVCCLGSAAEVPRLLAASHVLVSVSAFEGLSLVHLEALAAGLPVVATDVGGAREVARQTSGFHLLPRDASAAAFARVLATVVMHRTRARLTFPRSFTRRRMAARTLSLYLPAIARRLRSRGSEGVCLITNNFSTGGAQSSARRLLLGLKSQGVKVRAVVVEEDPSHPTIGHAALLQSGVAVTAIAPADGGDPTAAVSEILARLGADPPRCVVFWNLIASYKVLLADGLLDTPVYDVSPGAMYFESLERYFANPRPGVPYLAPREYGARLAGVVVKYVAEAERAAERLVAPVHVIPNGVAFDSPARARSNSTKIIIGTAARISPDKRLEELIEAVRIAHSRLPAYELHIAGGVEQGQNLYFKQLRNVARGLPVRWRGEVVDIKTFLHGLDLFAMISEPAGCPNASLEAMAVGLPVIASDVGGAAEQVLDRITGRLTPRGDTHAFAEALVEVACDRALRHRFGANARERIRLHFSLDRMIAEYLALFSGRPKTDGQSPPKVYTLPHSCAVGQR